MIHSKYLIIVCLLLFYSAVSFAQVAGDISSGITDDDVRIDGKSLHEILEEYNIDKEDFISVKKMNEAEKRLSEYKDSDEKLIAKLIMLEYINKSRKRYNVNLLKLDILASRVANQMSKEAAENKFHGHWNMRGEKPYHRYAFAGGVDHVSENASAYYSSASIKNSFSNKINMMKSSHTRFMAEKSPNDGHKKNVIEKSHNHVGLGYHLDNKEFRYYEEYIDRYLDIRVEKTTYELNGEAEFSFKPLFEGYYPYAVIVYREAPLKKMTAAAINRKSSYPDYSRDKSLTLWPWQLAPADKNGYTNVSITVHKTGTYYVHVYLSKKAYTKGRSASTRGKLRASGIVFKVE